MMRGQVPIPARLRLYDPDGLPEGSTPARLESHWSIDGKPFTVQVLVGGPRPPEAQAMAPGVWCLLRAE